MKKVYSKETYRIRTLEQELNLPLVSDFKDRACQLLKEEYPELIEAYYHYKDVNREYKSLLNYLKKTYGRKTISQCSEGKFVNKQHKIDYKKYLTLLDRRRIYNEDYKKISPMVENLALKMYKATPKPKTSNKLKEFLKLLKGLVIYTTKVFYNQPVTDPDFVESIYQSCYLGYVQNYDRSFKKVDTFFVTHIINKLSKINDKEIPVEDFSRLDSEKNLSDTILVEKYNNELDRHLSWELTKRVL